MTHACCLDCRVRVFTASRADAPVCPDCGQPMATAAAAQIVGCRLATTQQMPTAAAAAAAGSPLPPGSRS